MAPPPPPASTRAAILALRLLTVATLVISIVVLTTNTATLQVQTVSAKLRFNDVYAYRYMLSAAVIGLAYTVVQTFFAILQIAAGSGESNFLFDFYGDKIASYMLATGAAAGFGVTKDLKDVFGILFDNFGDSADKFFNKGYAAASVLLVAFVCTAILSVFSSYALPKRLVQ